MTFRRSKRLDQISLSNRLFAELRRLDQELAKIPPESQYDNGRNQVYYRLFGTLDYLSFLVNRKMIEDMWLLDYMRPFIIRYYEDTFLTQASVDERGSQSYQEFKKFYLKLKKK